MAYYPGLKLTTEKKQLYFANLRNVEALGLQVKNTSGSALTSFIVQVRLDSEASWVNIAETSDDFLMPPFGSLIAFSSGDPSTLRVGSSVLLGLDRLASIAELQILSSATTSAVVDIFEYKDEAHAATLSKFS